MEYSNTLTVTLLFIIATLFTGVVVSLENGVGRTPPMGWNSWNHFYCGIDEKLIRETADALVDFGLAEAGYKYLNTDDCWMGGRNKKGQLYSDPKTFPSGMKALADYAHSKGLFFGLYSDAGILTCDRRVGSLGFEKQDALTFASWEVDYLKYDNCFNDGQPEPRRYTTMRDALNATGRKIYFSICEWGLSEPYLWAPEVGNSWRTTYDISANWGSIMFILDRQKNITHIAGPGKWNDPDMLQVGNGNLTVDEQKSHFSLWAALKAPLLLGFDIRTPPKDTLNIVLNKEIIAINQDPLGLSVSVAESTEPFDIWCGTLVDGHVALLLNKAEETQTITLDFSKHCKLTGKIQVRDLWEGVDKGSYTNSYSSTIPRHGITVLKLRTYSNSESTY